MAQRAVTTRTERAGPGGGCRWPGLAALLAAALLAGAAPVGAQSTAPAAGPTAAPGAGAKAPAAPPSAVAPGEIVTRAEQLRIRLAQIENQRPSRMLGEIGDELTALDTEVAAVAKRIEKALAWRHMPGELESLSSAAERLDRRFEDLVERIVGEADALDDQLAELARETESWKLTLREPRTTVTPALADGVRSTLQSLQSAHERIGTDLDAVLALQRRLTLGRSSLTTSLARLDRARSELTAGLWVRQDPPLWESAPAAREIAGVPGRAADVLAGVWKDLASYASTHRDAIVVQVGLFLFLAWFLRRTRVRRGLRQGAQAPFHADALRHPFAAAFLIAALFSPFIQPERVRGVALILGPAGLCAWYLVLSGLLAPVLHPPVLGLAALWMLEHVRGAFIALPLVDRGLLVFDLAVALVGVVWLRRPQRLRHVPWQVARGPWTALLSSWMRVLPPALAIGLGAAVLGYTRLADTIATVLIWGTVAGTGWVALVAVAEAVAEHFVESGALAHLRLIDGARHQTLRIVRRGLRVGGLFAWLYTALSAAGLWSPFRNGVAAVLSYPVGYGAETLSVGALVAFGLTLWISWTLARFVPLVLDRDVFSRVHLSTGVPFALETFARYTVLVIGFIAAMGAIGFSIDRVALLLSALGVGIGFGLQNVVNNFVSGLILLFERPVRVGDWVQIEDLFGYVSVIGIRASRVRTLDGADVVVPNGDFTSARVVNWTLSDHKRRLTLPVGVAYGTDPRRVIELLEQTARAHPQVLDDPAPTALFRSFGDSSLNFELRAFTEADWTIVSSELAVAVNDALRDADISIPFPQRDLHVRSADALRDALAAGARGGSGPSES